MVEEALSVDRAAANWELAELVEQSARLAALGADMQELHDRLLVNWIKPPQSADLVGLRERSDT
jgi:hypothetical protein